MPLLPGVFFLIVLFDSFVQKVISEEREAREARQISPQEALHYFPGVTHAAPRRTQSNGYNAAPLTPPPGVAPVTPGVATVTPTHGAIEMTPPPGAIEMTPPGSSENVPSQLARALSAPRMPGPPMT